MFPSYPNCVLSPLGARQGVLGRLHTFLFSEPRTSLWCERLRVGELAQMCKVIFCFEGPALAAVCLGFSVGFSICSVSARKVKRA